MSGRAMKPAALVKGKIASNVFFSKFVGYLTICLEIDILSMVFFKK